MSSQVRKIKNLHHWMPDSSSVLWMFVINILTQTLLHNLLLALCPSCAVIPYHITICTGLERDASTTSRAFVIIIGANHTQTERLWLDLPDGRKGFEAGSLESFESCGSDVGEIKKVEVREEAKLLEFQRASCTLLHPHTHTHMNMQKKIHPHCLK